MLRPVVSAVLGLGLLAVAGTAQPPATDGKPAVKKAAPKPAEKKPADGVETQIEAALGNDPDVRMARAKIALAEAELAKARQAVALRVNTLRAGIEEHKLLVDAARRGLADAEARRRAGASPQSELLQAQIALVKAQSGLAPLEAELKLLVGDGPKPGAALPPDQNPSVLAELALRLAHDPGHSDALWIHLLAAQKRRPAPVQACTACHDAPNPADLLGADWHGCPGIVQQLARPAAPAAPKGPVPDRLRAVLDKPVSLGPKGTRVTFGEALEAFKAVGLDVPVRVTNNIDPIQSLGEELPVAAWLQLYADQAAGTHVLVREYGLLVTREGAPPDAVSVFDLWKSKPAGGKAAAAARRHDFDRAKLPAGAIRAKAGDAIAVAQNVKPEDVEDFQIKSDNPGVVAGGETVNGAFAVVIRSAAAGTAKVRWKITTATGQVFAHDGLEVVFE